MKCVFTISRPSGPIFFCWQKSQGNFLATTCSDNYVRIYNRHGEAVAEFGLPGSCTGFGWDQDGDTLAVICDKSGIIYLWDANNRKLSQVDSGFKDTLTFMTWSKDAPLLAIGTVKGNLLIFSHRNARKIPLLGKHTKRIKAGAWSNKNLLALSGEDKLLTISNAEGDTLHQILVGGDPENIQFSEMKSNERSNMGENTVSLIKNKKTLFLYNMNDPENPVELAFQQKYGDISAYHWYGDGYIMIGFSQGYFVVISTHLKEIGQEIYQVRNHKDNLCSIAISQSLGKAASAGDNCVKIHDLQDLKQLHDIVTLEDERSLDRIGWTEDGQLLAIATSRGAVHVFLTKLPVLGASNFTRIAYLTSLLEVTIQDNIHDEKPIAVPIEVESSFMALGPYHLVVGMNNRAWVHVLTEKGIVRMKERDYLSTVDSCKVNSDYIAVLCSDGKLTLQMIDELQPGMSPEKETRMFPDNNKDRITCHDMSRDFLIYGTDKGKIYYFYMEDWNFVTECDHSANTASRSVVGIRKLFADTSGSHLIYIDDKSDGFLYNPVIDASLEIPNISPKTVGALWDCNPPDKGVFITYDTERIFTYIYLRESSKGPRVSFVGETKLPYGHEPLMLHSGSLTLMTTSGSVQIVTLETHAFLMSDRQQTYEQKQINLGKAVALRRFRDAYQLCVELKQPNAWMDLASAALESLDIEFAIKVYRLLGDVGMVMSLQTIKDVEDRNLLAGYVAMFLEDFTSAQDLFLSSSRPVAALEMRRDLMNWDAALQLAKTLASHEIPFISREYAQQLEFTGDYVSALRHYEAGVTKDERFGEHDEACAAGVARTCLRTGDLRRGVKMALMMPSISLKKECAAILEGMKQFTESAMLYEKGGFPDKAASVYIRAKNWTKVGELLPLVSSPKIHGQYARAKEAEGRYKEAAAAYENAKDWDNVIRINLEHLRNPDEAVRIVRSTQSVDGAKMVAKFFENLKDYHSAIQFLVLSKCNDEAFQMAQKHRLMEKYAEIVGSDATAEDYQSIAVYFEGEKNHFLAGKFYHLSGQHAQALNHLLNIREDEAEHTDALNLAVDVIGSAADQKLTMHLMSFLLGDVDGNPKDPKFLFRLYMALKQYREAARTATVIAREEQNAGSYRTAHDLLFSMYHELRKNKIKIPAEMGNSLMILHSYILVKMHVKREDHLKAARMLIRVANNISKFPSHIVNILTSTVIECQRAGLKNSAFGFAAMLMRPEYRDKIDLKYKKKLEMIVRKPDKSELEEPTSPCPYCGEILAETELVCSGCKNNIPFCIATGRHIVKDDLTVCPNCQFPAIMPDLISLLASEDGRCPMCSEKVDIQSIEKVTNLSSVLNPDEGAED